MKHFSFIYKDLDEFNEYIQTNKIDSYNHILVQVFTCHCDIIYIHMLQEVITTSLPNAKIIGASTSGEINSDGLQENKTIFSISCFENTTIKNVLVKGNDTDSETLGKKIIRGFEQEDIQNSQLAITFTDGLHTNGEMYLWGINSIHPNLKIAGGMAGDYSKFLHTFVFTEKEVTVNGSVMALLINPNLHIYNDFSFDWVAIGPKHTVTKSEGNRIYTIDGMTPLEFYRNYLGDNVAKALPAIGIEFPLMIIDNNIEIARAVIGKHDDGSLTFAGNIKEGTTIKFGFGNVNNIVNKGSQTLEKIQNLSVEGIYIYSCMARKYLLREHINTELHPLTKIANVAGFFTYGEFYSQKEQNFLFNQSMTILGISESEIKTSNIASNLIDHNKLQINNHSLLRLEALSNLVTKTSQDYDLLNENLHEQVEEEIEKNREKDIVLEMNAKHAQLGEMLEMILHQWRQPLNGMNMILSGAKIHKELGVLTEEKMDSNRDELLNYIDHLNTTINDFRAYFTNNNEKQKIRPSELIEKVQMFTNSLCKRENIECIKEFNYDEPVLIDTNKLVQVLMNLVKNSIDALVENQPTNRTIITRISKDEKFLIVELGDNGGGISEDILPKIFDRRFTTKHHNDGTGIGLDMSKTIVESHMQGKISASNTTVGALFTIKIPV